MYIWMCILWTITYMWSSIHRTDPENNRFIYSQDFPEKSLNGHYDFKASVLGRNIHTKGEWNITLYEYTWVIIFVFTPKNIRVIPTTNITQTNDERHSCWWTGQQHQSAHRNRSSGGHANARDRSVQRAENHREYRGFRDQQFVAAELSICQAADQWFDKQRIYGHFQRFVQIFGHWSVHSGLTD